MMNRRTTRTISGFLLILLLCAALLSGAVLADGPAYGAGPFLTRPALPGQSALPGVTGIDDGPHALAWIFAPASIIVIGGTAAVSLSDGAEPMAVFSATVPMVPARKQNSVPNRSLMY